MSAPSRRGRNPRGFTLVGCFALTLAPACSSPRRAPAAPEADSPSAEAAASGAAPIDEDEREPVSPAAASPDFVRIKVIVDATRKAHVFWGRKDLGVAPLELQRPRGSGPLDLLIVADGALPLHARVFTDRDDTLAVRLYGEADAPGLLGYPRSFSLPTSPRFTHNAGTFPRPRR